MTYKTYVRQDLANFTNRPAASFSETYLTASAFPQARLLFKLATCLQTLDGLTEDQLQLADFAMLAMADHIQLSAKHAAALASPFNSESIGSYSYSKTAQAIRNGDATGVMWFDLAIEQLSVCDVISGNFLSGGIEMFEYDGMFAPGAVSGNVAFLTPGDLAVSRSLGYDPAPGLTGPVPSPVSPTPDGEVPTSWVEDPPGSGLYIPGV